MTSLLKSISYIIGHSERIIKLFNINLYIPLLNLDGATDCFLVSLPV